MKTKSFSIFLLVISLLISCKKDNNSDPSANGYIAVKQGPWEFELIYDGDIFLHFTGGNLNQKKSYVYFDNDSYFAGYLDGDFWSGENTIQRFIFAGKFSGTPADTFNGTLTTTDGSNKTVEMIGKYGKFK